MKKETRKVTVEQEVYIAEDGKEFDDEDDCLSHERDLLEEKLEFYKRDLTNGTLENCSYVYVKSAEDVANLLTLCDMDGIAISGLSNKPGVYMYSNRGDYWINISEVVDTITRGENR